MFSLHHFDWDPTGQTEEMKQNVPNKLLKKSLHSTLSLSSHAAVLLASSAHLQPPQTQSLSKTRRDFPVCAALCLPLAGYLRGSPLCKEIMT